MALTILGLFLIIVPGTCPDIESDDSHALIVGKSGSGFRSFGPQNIEVIKDALQHNLGSDTPPETISELANLVFLELAFQSLSWKEAKHVRSGGTTSTTILLNAPSTGHMVARTGTNGDAISLGQFTIERIVSTNPYWQDCDPDYCGTWTFKESPSPSEIAEVCLIIGFFRD